MKQGQLVGGKYRLTRPLGQGAMGVVWEAIHEHTSRRLALKLILNATEDLRARLLREARACGRISHRNVIEIYDTGETEEGDPFLIMQLLSGETLQARLKREQRIEPQEAARIGRDVARALAAAHAEGIIHRDLKPANVFLHQEAGTSGAVVKVLDFGVCKTLTGEESLTVPGGLVGSPSYMSPEQIMGARLDHRSDLWALGVLLFEMIAGQRPFRGRGPDLVAAIVGEPIPTLAERVPGIDPDLSAIVAQCLQRDPARRFNTAAEAAARLEPHAERSALSAPRPVPEVVDDGELAMTLPLRPQMLANARPAPGQAQPGAQGGHRFPQTVKINTAEVEQAMAAASARQAAQGMPMQSAPAAYPPPGHAALDRTEPLMRGGSGGWPAATGSALPAPQMGPPPQYPPAGPLPAPGPGWSGQYPMVPPPVGFATTGNYPQVAGGMQQPPAPAPQAMPAPAPPSGVRPAVLLAVGAVVLVLLGALIYVLSQRSPASSAPEGAASSSAGAREGKSPASGR
jgi:serine/threonine-protein kinase